jgi:hypothetical protein
MNLESPANQLSEPKPLVFAQLSKPARQGASIERCEFEQLLLRAMEILNARDLKTQLEPKHS